MRDTPPTSPDGEATPADPGAIDLEAIRKRYCVQFYAGKLDPPSQAMADLIAAVEELRAVILRHGRKEVEALHHEIEALRARVVELEPLVQNGVRVAQNCMEWQSRAEAAEVREAALAGALETVPLGRQPGRNRDWVCRYCYIQSELTAVTQHTKDCFVPRVRAVLAATPAQGMERARALEKVVKWAREMFGDGGAIRPYAFEEMEKALGKLDALSKERPTAPCLT